jgi:hypothetical protein
VIYLKKFSANKTGTSGVWQISRAVLETTLASRTQAQAQEMEANENFIVFFADSDAQSSSIRTDAKHRPSRNFCFRLQICCTNRRALTGKPWAR